MNDAGPTPAHSMPPRWLTTLLVLCALVGGARTVQSQSNNTVAYTFTTLAGTPGTGYADGVGNNAQFNLPQGVAVDSAGNIFVSDGGNNVIRKITSSGVVSTVAGLAGVTGTNDGAGSTARFNTPVGITLDASGNLYVADSGNSTIRKITPNSVVSTFAGMPKVGGTNDGPASLAQFNTPQFVVFDSAGNLYVADYGNYTIRRITPGGVVSTFAGTPGAYGYGDGPANVAQFYTPYGLALDSAGNLYVGDAYNDTIRMITPGGVVSTIAGSPVEPPGAADGVGGNARFDVPEGVAVDGAGNVYVAAAGDNTIRMITPTVTGGQTNWTVSTLAGNAAFFDDFARFGAGYADGTGTNALFSHATGIALDSSGNVYAADYGNNVIRKIKPAGVVSTLAGRAVSYGSADGTGSGAQFNNPWGIAADAVGDIYVADHGNNTVREITSAGVVSTPAGMAGVSGNVDGPGNQARFHNPCGISVDGAGNVYVADAANLLVRIINPAGVVSSPILPCGCLDDSLRFFGLETAAAGPNGTFYVVDTSVVKIATPVTGGWSVTTLAGSTPGFADGTGAAAQFNSPQGIAVDGAGNVFVADTFNQVIRWITPDGMVTTLAGLAGNAGSTDGTGAAARFTSPYGVAVDNSGNVFVADYGNNTIREVTPAGVVTTVAGMAGSYGSADGTGGAARFYYPRGVAVDGAGNLYVTDSANNTIRKGVFSQFTAANPVPFAPPPSTGQLAVTLLPPEANGQWRFPWETSWRNSGTAATNLAQGEYAVEFRDIPGYLAIPLSGPVAVTNGGATLLTNQYYATLIQSDASTGGGSLTVNIGPSPPNGAGWRFVGGTGSFSPPGYSTNLLGGNYLVEFAPVAGFVTPASLSIQVAPGLPTVLSITYLLASSPPAGVYLPVPVPSGNISDLADYPFGFNGQLQTDVGYGSGVAVQTNVVLTAAHLIFNDQTLSFVNQAYWFYQEEAGVFAPDPLPARGWYVLSGYAAQRTNDVLGGLGPDQSSPQSRNMDVAALYFQSPVANGGYGGFLPSDATPNSWLTSSAEKMLTGYPVDGSQFGFGNIINGEMYEIGPQPYTLSQATDPVADQQVYTAPWMLSFPGNSGGPFYVQLNGYYYPAGVYLGTLFNGTVPQASAVRAIDSNVVNLITLAASLGDTGTNNSGGGVITIIPSQAVSRNNPGYLILQLGPPSAVQAGAAWELSGQPVGDYSTANPSLQEVTTTNALLVQFKPIPGWNLPTNRSVTVVPGLILTNIAAYTVTNPVLTLDLVNGLRMSGTTNTTWQIQSNSSLTGTWVPFQTNTLTNFGLNLITNHAHPGFYRALWLTNSP